MTTSAPPPRRALVTGCSSGIGAAIVADLLGEGWSVTGLSRRAPQGLGPNFSHRAVDLGAAEGFEAALDGLEPPQALIHAAGVLRVGDHAALSPQDGLAMWRLHVEAPARLIRRFAPAMADGARIVLIGSRLASGAPGRGLYAATKAAQIALARSLAAELAPRAITVNVVAPAAVDTPMLRDPARAGVAPRLPPMGRFVRADEVAAAVRYLASPQAGAVTGQTLTICAGASL